MLQPARLLSVLQRLQFTRQRSAGTLFRGQYTLGVTRGARGSDGFPDGFNYEIARKDLCCFERNLLHELWKLLQAEGEALSIEFTSAQVSNFAPAWRGRHDHRKKDTNFQWCASLGEFDGGELRWLEGGDSFAAPTRDRWVKVDGRHTHWVEPYESGTLLCCFAAQAKRNQFGIILPQPPVIAQSQ